MRRGRHSRGISEDERLRLSAADHLWNVCDRAKRLRPYVRHLQRGKHADISECMRVMRSVQAALNLAASALGELGRREQGS